MTIIPICPDGKMYLALVDKDIDPMLVLDKLKKQRDRALKTLSSAAALCSNERFIEACIEKEDWEAIGMESQKWLDSIKKWKETEMCIDFLSRMQ